VVGLIFAWIYSAPPLRLKQNGWFGNAAVGFSYESLAWITGAAVMIGGAMPDWRILAGVALRPRRPRHHDPERLQGHRGRQADGRALAAGPARRQNGAAWVACIVMIVPQLVVVGLLFAGMQPVHAAAVAGLVMVQITLMVRFLDDPVARATWLSGSASPSTSAA
jgi:chlorophyll synthase